MLVRALTDFVSETGTHHSGDEFEMEDGLAVVRIQGGLVQRVPSEPERAVKAEPEQAVTRKRGR